MNKLSTIDLVRKGYPYHGTIMAIDMSASTVTVQTAKTCRLKGVVFLKAQI